jgi:hypothetical protein
MPSTVVDSSVWIDFFNKRPTPQSAEVKSILISSVIKSPFIILPVIMQEVLQGIEDTKLFTIVKENLFGLEFIDLDNYDIAVKSAQLFSFLRKKGVTIRKPNDCLIAAICIENNFSIIHNDKDFDNIAKHTSLKIYK